MTDKDQLSELVDDVRKLMAWRWMILGGFSVLAVIGGVGVRMIGTAADIVMSTHDAQVVQAVQIKDLDGRVQAVEHNVCAADDPQPLRRYGYTHGHE